MGEPKAPLDDKGKSFEMEKEPNRLLLAAHRKRAPRQAVYAQTIGFSSGCWAVLHGCPTVWPCRRGGFFSGARWGAGAMIAVAYAWRDLCINVREWLFIRLRPGPRLHLSFSMHSCDAMVRKGAISSSISGRRVERRSGVASTSRAAQDAILPTKRVPVALPQ